MALVSAGKPPVWRAKWHKVGRWLSGYSLLILVLMIYLAPLMWFLATALKTSAAKLYAYPPEFIPRPFTLQNFLEVNEVFPFFRYTFNTTVIASATALLQVAFCSLAAYPLARMRFLGQQVIFYAILATVIIPFHSIMIPLFLVVQRLGLVDTHLGVILPFTVDAFSIFLLRQAFRGISQELADSAKLDGAPEFIIFTHIMLPLIKPALATVAIFAFTTQWNEFLWPLLVLKSSGRYTLQLGVAGLMSMFGASWQHIAAVSFLSVLPVVVFFLLLQRYFISGLTAGALKG